MMMVVAYYAPFWIYLPAPRCSISTPVGAADFGGPGPSRGIGNSNTAGG